MLDVRPLAKALCVKIMNEIRHLIIASSINGPLAASIFVLYAWYRYGIHWSPDLPFVFLFGTVLVALFFGLVCWPILRFVIGTKNRLLNMAVCSIAGIVSVMLFFLIFTHYHFDIEFMIYKLWLYHLIFGLVGSIYGYMCSTHVHA